MDFPVILKMDSPSIYVYSVYSVVAEKFEAIVSLGNANSRYKDFYDIYVIASRYDLNGNMLAEAVRETFNHRGTLLKDIFAFEDAFVKSELHQNRWKAFIKKKRTLLPVSIEETIKLLRTLLCPIADSINSNVPYSAVWHHETQNWLFR